MQEAKPGELFEIIDRYHPDLKYFHWIVSHEAVPNSRKKAKKLFKDAKQVRFSIDTRYPEEDICISDTSELVKILDKMKAKGLFEPDTDKWVNDTSPFLPVGIYLAEEEAEALAGGKSVETIKIVHAKDINPNYGTLSDRVYIEILKGRGYVPVDARELVGK